MMRVAILGGARTPFARANTAYAEQGNLEMLSAALTAVVERYGLRGEKLGEVVAGAVMKHPRDWNLAREAALSAGLHAHTPAYDVQRACGTSLTAAVQLAHRIALGEIDSGIAGGADSASHIPTLNPSGAGVGERRTGLSMGEHCELMAKEWGIGRAEQDELALQSHRKAASAWQGGFYDDLVSSFGGLSRDNNVREDASLEKLAALGPAFDRSDSGTLTAGNSTPLTDGAACVLLASEAWAKARGIPVQAYLTFSGSAAVDYAGLAGPREGLLMGPTYAVTEMLDRAGRSLQDFDIYEIHEAFAAQVLCTLKAWESEDYCRTRLGRKGPLGAIDRGKLNPKGGSVAIGHPFGATGARIVAGLAKQLAERGSGRGLISVCAAGGMGVTAILER